jgi:hypothetical protein
MLISLEVMTATDIHVLTPEMTITKKTRRTRRKEARLVMLGKMMRNWI